MPKHWFQDDGSYIKPPHGPQPEMYSCPQEYLQARNLYHWIGQSQGLAQEHRPARPGEYNHATGDYEPPALEDAMTTKKSSLDTDDHRWVELESTRFLAANTDTLDDNHELATRAHAYAAMKTSTFTPARSAAICERFVARVANLGRRAYRPAVVRTAAYQDFDDQAIYLC